MKNKVAFQIFASLVLDVLAVLFIIFLGDISRFIGYPMYILDPMRMMVILAIAFTPRWNSWVLALLLPFVSYYIGAHPPVTKTILMAAELLLNVWLFWYLLDKIKFSLLAILISIVFSKVIYYMLKYLCLQLGWLSGELMATPFDVQVITTISFSVFIFLVFMFGHKSSKR